MAQDITLLIDGIEGESKISGHENEIDVIQFSIESTQSGTMHIAGGGGAGKVNVGDLKIRKISDMATVRLFKAICLGTHIPSMKLTARKAGDPALEYYTIEMEECIVSSIEHVGASDDTSYIAEEVCFNFAKIKTIYVKQEQDGSGGDQAEFKFDIPGNVEV